MALLLNALLLPLKVGVHGLTLADAVEEGLVLARDLDVTLAAETAVQTASLTATRSRCGQMVIQGGLLHDPGHTLIQRLVVPHDSLLAISFKLRLLGVAGHVSEGLRRTHIDRRLYTMDCLTMLPVGTILHTFGAHAGGSLGFTKCHFLNFRAGEVTDSPNRILFCLLG